MKKQNALAMAITLLAVIFVVLLSYPLFAGETPKSEKEIPVYKGAVRDAARESEIRSQMAWDIDPTLRKTVLNVYKVSASAEDIFNFYLQKIGGKEGMLDMDPSEMKPNSLSPVFYDIGYYKDEEFTDYTIDHDVMHHGILMKQKLVENRKPHKPGKWINEANFNWYHKESNNDLTTFYLIIHDESFDIAKPENYKTSTEIQVQVTTVKSEQAIQAENDERMDNQADQLSRSLKNKPPTEKELGVPVYPGSTFDAENSAGMSAGNDYAIYLYLTTDSPSKVASFYEQKLKIKAEEVMKGNYMIPLKGKMPMPEEGISIQPNTMFVGKAKTVITIQKKVQE